MVGLHRPLEHGQLANGRIDSGAGVEQSDAGRVVFADVTGELIRGVRTEEIADERHVVTRRALISATSCAGRGAASSAKRMFCTRTDVGEASAPRM